MFWISQEKMVEPPLESPTLEHDLIYLVESQALSTPLDIVSLVYDADFKVEFSTQL